MVEKENPKEEQLSVKFSDLWRGDKLLMKDADLSLCEGDKVAIIGRNGCGKSTLLESIYCISHGLILDSSIEFEGEIMVHEGIKVGYLPQDVRLEFDGTVLEYINAQVGLKASIYNAYQRFTEKPVEEVQYNDEYAKVLVLMDQYSLWNYPQDLEKILIGLKIPVEFLGRKVKTLSGGEATKIALASLLISEPDLILLDEPTNNLDLDNIRFLEDWFRKTEVSLLVVSHDRVFLNNVINSIWEVDEETQTLIRYGGNYSLYEAEKEKQFEGRVRSFEQQERARKKLETDIERLKESSNKFETTSNDDFYRAKGARVARTAVVRGRRIERDLKKLGKPQKPHLPNFAVEESVVKEGNILDIRNLNFGYDSKVLLKNIELKVNAGDRICITGPNGVGKSTLIKLMLKELSNEAVSLNKDVKISYIPQTIVPQNPNQNILSYIGEHLSLSEEKLSKILGRVLFTNPVFLKVENFSIG